MRKLFALSAVALSALIALAPAAFATVTYTYDELGRVTSITYDDGKKVIYTYDAAGNRTTRVVQ